MNSNKTTTEENRRRRKLGNLEIDIPIPCKQLVVVKKEHSKNDIESEDISLAKIQRRREEK